MTPEPEAAVGKSNGTKRRAGRCSTCSMTSTTAGPAGPGLTTQLAPPSCASVAGGGVGRVGLGGEFGEGVVDPVGDEVAHVR